MVGHDVFGRAWRSCAHKPARMVRNAHARAHTHTTRTHSLAHSHSRSVRRHAPSLSAPGCTALVLALALLSAHAQYAPLDGSNHHPVAGMNAVGGSFWPRATHYTDGISGMDVELFNPRNISNIVHGAGANVYNSHGISSMFAGWGQWVAHDAIMTGMQSGNVSAGDVLHVRVPLCDAYFDAACTGSQTLHFARNRYNVSTGTSTSNPRRQLNAQTGWIDASTVYGESNARTIQLRTFYSGLLLADPVNGVPVNVHCVPMAGPFNNACQQRLTGDMRGNVAPSLLALHGLFILEHNRIARQLAVTYPAWNDERLFQEARKRIICIVQAITYNEYLPMLIGGTLPAYTGFNPQVDARIDPAFAIAAFRYGHSGINSVYMCVKANGKACHVQHLLLREVYFRPTYLDAGITIADLLRGQVVQRENEIDTALTPDVRSFLEGVMDDLAVRDILRGRDFGLPTYAQARADLGLSVPTSMADITSDIRVQEALNVAYGGRVDAVDLWVGGLAESATSNTFIGPTFRAIIVDQFQRLRDGDRYWYANTALVDSNGVPYLDNATRIELGKTRLGDVIARNTDWTSAPSNVFSAQDQLLQVSADGSSGTSGSGSSSSSTGATGSTTSGGASGATTSTAPAVARAAVNSVLALEWSVANSAITITFKFQGSGWLGFGIDSSVMQGADSWMMRYVGGAGEVLDARAPSGSYSAPITDSVQNTQLVSATQSGGITTFTVTRALTSSDATDATFRTGSIPVIFAWDTSSTTYGYHGGNRIAVAINFLAAAAAAAANAGGNGSSNATFGDDVVLGTIDNSAEIAALLLERYGAHGLTMFSVWGILVPVGVVAMRFLKHLPAHQTFHKFSMITGATVTLPAAAAALVQTSNRNAVAHRTIGLLLAASIGGQVIVGVAVRSWLRSDKPPPSYWMRVRQVHRVLGYIMVATGLANCYLGADMLLRGYGRWLVLSYIVALIVGYIGLSLHDEFYRDRTSNTLIVLDKNNARRLAMSQAANSMSLADVRANVAAGCRWVIVQGWIYDVAGFLKNHPGGAFLIERCIGGDITQLFLGREAFDASVRAHPHSERAYKLLRTMCVGVLRSDLELTSWADAPSMADRSLDTWQLVKRTVMPGDSRRPIVKLEFNHPSAGASAAFEWKPSSFGRYMVVKAALSAAEEARKGSRPSSGVRKSIMSQLPSFAVARKSKSGGGRERGGERNGHAQDDGHYGSVDYSRGSVTGNTPKHVQLAMQSWYGRSSRQLSMTDTLGGEAGTYAGRNGGPSPWAATSAPEFVKGRGRSLDTRGRLRSSMRSSARIAPAMDDAVGAKRSVSASHASPGMTGVRRRKYSEDDEESDTEAGFNPVASTRGNAASAMMGPAADMRERSPRGPRSSVESQAAIIRNGVPLVERPYTIVRPDNKAGLVMYVRRYETGLMSNYLYGLREGDEVLMSGPEGLGMHLHEEQGGIIVAIMQGTCVCAVFDLLQHMQAHAAARKTRAASRRQPVMWSREQLASASKEAHTRAAPSADDLASAAKPAARPANRGEGVRNATSSTRDPLEAMLMPPPTPQTQDPSERRRTFPGAVHSSHPEDEEQNDREHDGDSYTVDTSTTAAAVRRVLDPAAGAARASVHPPDAIAVGSITTTRAVDETRYRQILMSASHSDLGVSRRGDGATTESNGRVAVVVDEDSRSAGSTYDSDGESVEGRQEFVKVRKGFGPKGSTEEKRVPRYKLVLLAVAEHEGAIPEIGWLRWLDANLPDFELHVNVMRGSDAAASTPRTYFGRVTPRRLERLLPPANLLTVSVCGTPAFTSGIHSMYRDMGLPRTLLTTVG